jgi:hypothetical protein
MKSKQSKQLHILMSETRTPGGVRHTPVMAFHNTDDMVAWVRREKPEFRLHESGPSWLWVSSLDVMEVLVHKTRGHTITVFEPAE